MGTTKSFLSKKTYNKKLPKTIKKHQRGRIYLKNTSPTFVINWFDRNPPLGGIGKIKLAEAYLEQGKLVEVETRKRSGSSVMKKYYERKEITLLADLADIDSKMADIDLQLNRPGEGEGLSADVVQDSLDDSSEEE